MGISRCTAYISKHFCFTEWDAFSVYFFIALILTLLKVLILLKEKKRTLLTHFCLIFFFHLMLPLKEKELNSWPGLDQIQLNWERQHCNGLLGELQVRGSLPVLSPCWDTQLSTHWAKNHSPGCQELTATLSSLGVPTVPISCTPFAIPYFSCAFLHFLHFLTTFHAVTKQYFHTRTASLYCMVG